MSFLTGATSQDDVTFTLQFQRLECFQISVNKLCILTVSLQNRKHEMKTRFLFFFLLKIKISKERRTSSKLSLTDGGNVSHQKSVHSPLSTLPVGIGDTLATFKANQLAIFTNEGPSYFFFFDQNIGRKRSFF